MLKSPKGETVFWEQFFASEPKVLAFLKDWCSKSNKILRICGRSNDTKGVEASYFSSHLEGCNWEFVPNSGPFSAYELIDSAEIVVGIDSTLCYEALGRGNKTAVFSCRGDHLNNDAARFGWPAALPLDGPFWTSKVAPDKFQEIMDFLATVSETDWNAIRQTYTTELMQYDAGNTRFVALIEQLLSSEQTAYAN